MSTFPIFTKIKKTSCKIQCVLHMTRFLVENFAERWIRGIIAFRYVVRHLLVTGICSSVLIRNKCDKKFTEPKKNYMRMIKNLPFSSLIESICLTKVHVETDFTHIWDWIGRHRLDKLKVISIEGINDIWRYILGIRCMRLLLWIVHL